jgi:hypothetical protein
VVQFEKEASQTRDYRGAENAPPRLAQILRCAKEGLLRMTSEPLPAMDQVWRQALDRTYPAGLAWLTGIPMPKEQAAERWTRSTASSF